MSIDVSIPELVGVRRNIETFLWSDSFTQQQLTLTVSVDGSKRDFALLDTDDQPINAGGEVTVAVGPGFTVVQISDWGDAETGAKLKVTVNTESLERSGTATIVRL